MGRVKINLFDVLDKYEYWKGKCVKSVLIEFSFGVSTCRNKGNKSDLEAPYLPGASTRPEVQGALPPALTFVLLRLFFTNKHHTGLEVLPGYFFVWIVGRWYSSWQSREWNQPSVHSTLKKAFYCNASVSTDYGSSWHAKLDFVEAKRDFGWQHTVVILFAAMFTNITFVNILLFAFRSCVCWNWRNHRHRVLRSHFSDMDVHRLGCAQRHHPAHLLHLHFLKFVHARALFQQLQLE